MTRTEEEAKRLWCPNAPEVAYTTGNPDTKCIASGCMAWRWTGNMKSVAPTTPCPDCCGDGDLPADYICGTCDGEGKIGHFEFTGYCGLAGKPKGVEA